MRSNLTCFWPYCQFPNILWAIVLILCEMVTNQSTNGKNLLKMTK
jgi:hypothetical protein